ncbi:MAG TPA: IS110 family transposase [Methylotenera sp.]|nr:IS110 family transposase [Methylotenera sp.]
MAIYDYYIGLDVSQKSTAICVIDSSGKQVYEGGALTRPADIYGWLSNRIDMSKSLKVGLEAGNMSSWLYTGLHKLGIEIVCMETFQAHRFLSTYRNKTDKNDARGLAHLLRMGGDDFLKLVTIRSQAAQETRALLIMRDHLVRQKVSLENHISGILKPFGLIIRRGNISAKTFYDSVIDAIAKAEDNGIHLRDTIKPSLLLYMSACNQIEPMNKKVEEIAKSIDMVQRFMEIPGVGPITALSFYAAVDYPERFKKSADVAAYFGLTPRQYQSGESNYIGGISKRGDPSTRRALVSAATVMLINTNDWNSMKAWGVRLSKRIGFSKARVAVARKLAVTMHKMWMNNDRFRPKKLSNKDVAALKAEVKPSLAAA